MTIPWWFSELGEAEKNSLIETFSQKRLTLSHTVKQVEERFASILDVPYVIMTNSGSSALLMALLAANIKAGDEVILPSLTWIATAQAPRILQAKVKLCDCQAEAPIIDAEELKKIISPDTKAVIPVHLNGRECDMEAIMDLASRSNAVVIEDACKAIFSKGKKGYLGTIGDMGCFSLGMISLVSVGYGGIVVTRKKEFYEKLKLIRDHGVEREPERYAYLGFNFKISDLLAALAIPQLQNIEKKIQNSLSLHNAYESMITHPEITILPIEKKSGKVPIYTEAYSECREEFISYLQGEGIQVSRYHQPVHRAPYLHSSDIFPNADRFTRNSFILPSGPSRNPDEINYVIKKINQFSKKGVLV